MIKKFLIILMVSLSLSACGNGTQLKIPGATIKSDAFEIKVDGDGQHRRHCPPGHAKKGWC